MDKNHMMISEVPELMQAFNDTTIDPTVTKAGSVHVAQWKCSVCGDEWESRIRSQLHRKRPTFGPNCLHGISLADVRPDLAKYWGPGNDRSPEELLPNSGYRAEFVLPSGRLIELTVNDAARLKNGIVPKIPMVYDVPHLREMYREDNERSSAEVSVSMRFVCLWDCSECGALITASPVHMYRDGSRKCCSAVHTRAAAEKQRKAQEIADENRRQEQARREKEKSEKLAARQQRRDDAEKARLQSKLDSDNRRIARIQAEGKSLAQANPELAATIIVGDPNRISATGGGRYPWYCEKGHAWVAETNTRHKHGSGCGVCSGRTALPGYNDALSAFPELARFWDYTLNDVTPDRLSTQSNRKVHLTCPDCQHSWFKPLQHFTAKTSRRQRGCVQCNPRSIEEAKMIDYLQRITGYNVAVLRQDRTLLGNGTELDAVFPGKDLAIEYNGIRWHCDHANNKNNHPGRHQDKYDRARNAGYRLVTVWSDTWTKRRKQSEGVLSQIMGCPQRKPVDVRDAVVTIALAGTADFDTAQLTMETTHPQGPAEAQFAVVAKLRSKVYAAMTAVVTAGVVRITRYVQRGPFIGGADAILDVLARYVRDNDLGSQIVYDQPHDLSDPVDWAADTRMVQGEDQPARFTTTDRDANKRREFDDLSYDEQQQVGITLWRCWDSGYTRFSMPVPPAAAVG